MADTEVPVGNPSGGKIGNKEADSPHRTPSGTPSPVAGSTLPMTSSRAGIDDDPENRDAHEELLRLHEELRPTFKITPKKS
jgi:hypothetical protein